MTRAKSGDTVTIHYVGTLDDGTQFDSSKGKDPLRFTLGSGQIIPGLDNAVQDMTVGDTETVTIKADEAYGGHDPAKVQQVPRNMIPAEIDLKVGVQLSGQTPTGEQISFTVTDVEAETVTVDANHPLAGKDLTFEVELVEIV